MRIGILAALPGELKPLVRGWNRQTTATKGVRIWTRITGADEWIAVCGGMGAKAALRSFTAAEALGRLDIVLSVGWAGALEEATNPGECYILSEIIDAQSGERFALTSGDRKLRIVTTARVADQAEKQRLRDTYGASLVDMEAASVARLAEMRGIEVCCIKAVSDGVGARLPDLNPFINTMGELRLLPFLAHVAVRPRLWGPLMQLGRTSAKAANALAVTISKFLEEKSSKRTDQTGAI